MTSVNVTTTKNTVTVNGETRVVTVKTRGPQGPSLPDGDKGDVTVSSNGTAISINSNAVTSAKIADGAIVDADINASAAIALSKLATGALPTAITVTSANISDLSIVNADINASAAIAGTKISPNFGSQSIISSLDGNQVTQGNAALTLTHATNTNLRANHFIVDDFPSGSGTYFIQATESGVSNDRNMCLQGYGGKLKIGSNSVAPTELLDVAGNIACSGTVDGRDLGADGTKLDGIESNATADQTASEILTLLKTVDGAGSGLNADTLDGISSASFLRSDTNDTFSGNLTVNGIIYLQDQIRIGDDAFIEDYNAANSVRIKGNQDNNKGFIAFGQQTKKLGVDGASAALTYDGNTVIDSAYTGALANGITATTQSASDNSTKVATTAYTDTAISNLVNSAPSTLDTLKELSDALGSDPNFATTVTNSIATKLPLAGGTLTGDLTISNTAPSLYFTDTNHDSDFRVMNQNGVFKIFDQTNSADRLEIYSGGQVVIDGNLDVGSGIDITGTITATSSISVPDAVSIFLGTGNDLSLKHDGSSSRIRNDTGALTISCGGSANANPVKIQPNEGEEGIVAHHNERVELYYDNSKKLETTTGGVAISGTLDIPSDSSKLRLGASDDLQLYHDGTHSYLDNATGNLHIRGNGADDVKIQAKNGEQSIICHHDGAVELYFDNSKKFETYANGIKLGDNVLAAFGDDVDLLIHHTGSTGYIKNQTGNFYIQNDGVIIIGNQSASTTGLKFNDGGAIELSHNNIKKFETTSSGAKISGTLLDINTTSANSAIVKLQTNVNSCEIEGRVVGGENNLILSANNSVDSLKITGGADGTVQLPNDNQKLQIGAGQDLQLYHNGSHSFIDDTGTGDMYIRGDNSLKIQNAAGSEQKIVAISNGAVELYYDHSKKLETTSYGVLSNQALKAEGDYIAIDNNGDSSYRLTRNGTALFTIRNNNVHNVHVNTQNSATLSFGVSTQNIHAGSIEQQLRIKGDTRHIQIPNDTSKLQIGAGQDLELYHDGSNSYLLNATGEFQIANSGSGNTIFLQAKAGENSVRALANGATELYYDSSKKLETISDGITVFGNLGLNTTSPKTLSGQTHLTINQAATGTQVAGIALRIGDADSGNIISYPSNGEGLRLTTFNANKDITFKKNISGTDTELFRITSAGHINIPNDNAMLRFGAGQDLKIAHTGSESYIQNSTGALQLQADDIKLFDHSTAHLYFRGQTNSSVELYYDNGKKFETTSTGAAVETSNSSTTESNADTLIVRNTNNGASTYAGIRLEASSVSTTDFYISNKKHSAGNGCDLRIGQGTTERLKITESGQIQIPDNGKFVAGTGSDLQIYHDGTNSFIKDTAGASFNILATESIAIKTNNTEFAIACNKNGSVELYNDNSKKLETASGGISVVGQIDLTRQNTASEGGEIAFRRANDNTKQWYIDVHGGTNDANLRFHSETGPNGSGRTYAELTFTEFKLNFGLDLKINNDASKIIMGSGDDFEIYHNGSNAYFVNTVGNQIFEANSGEKGVEIKTNGSVDLYYDNSKKLETKSTGIELHNGGLDLNRSTALHSGAIYFDSPTDTNHVLWNDYYGNPNTTRTTTDNFDGMKWNCYGGLQLFRGNEAETIAKFLGNGANELYYDNVKKLETTSTGALTTGQLKVDVDTNLNSATEYNGQDFGLLVSYDGGSSPNDEGNGICFAQKYYDQDAATIRTGAIIGYKTSGNGSFGGGLKFKVQDSGANPLKEMLRMKNDRVDIPQDTSLYIGANHDLRLVHDGSDSTISNTTGVFFIQNTGDLRLRVDDDDAAVHCVRNGQTALYYDNSLKLDTRSGGVGISGDLFFVDSTRIYMGSSNDFQLFHDGTNTHIVNSTGNLVYRSDTHHFKDKDNSDTHAKFVHDGAAELYYDNSKKLETTSDGVDVTGELDVAGDFRTSTARGINLDIQEGANGSRTSVTLTFTSAYNGKTVFVEMFVGSSNYHLHHVSHRYHNGGLNVLTNDGTGCTVTSSISGTSSSSTYTYTVTFDDSTSHPYARFIVSLGGYLISTLTSPSISFGT